MNFRKIGLILALTVSSAFAETEVKLSMEDADSFPFQMKNKTGTDLMLLEMVGKKVGVKFVYNLVPWERCLSEMQSNSVNGCFSASFKKERLEMGTYPMKGEVADESKQLHLASYSIFTTPEMAKTLKVNGMTIEGFDKTKEQIAVTRGFSIGDDLKKAGYLIDDSVSKTELNMRKLLAGRIKFYTTLTQDGDYQIALPEFKDKIVKVEPALVSKPYYLMFSKDFASKNADLVNKIYNAIQEVRESKEFKEESQKFISK